MRERLREIAESITRLDEERKTTAAGLREKNVQVLPDALERGLVHPVGSGLRDLKIAAVDGGLLAQEFHGFDLLMTRACAVMFSYRDGKRASHAYFPSALPPPEVEVTYTMDTHEFQRYKSLFRLRKEIGTALSACEKLSPDYMLLDGSLLPQVSDKPGAGEEEARILYGEVIALYSSLFSLCDEKGIRLVGVIKDSRGRRFIEILERMLVESERETLRRSSDTSFLSYLLKECERTASFSYSSAEKEQVVLKDLKDWGSRIAVFYVKPAEEDRPVRAEFLSTPHASAEEVASTVCALSRINKKYAMPAVLIEADLRAAMDPLDLERTYKDLFVRTGLRSAMMKLRRDSRPFR
ncbi:MAG: DNA double-strand break repair nuclease NurA [Candidatus ainarchaeum sp.]|nr:DNA double-strand break repair nuclease NurA [Candidatus ainarchaeum sp.]